MPVSYIGATLFHLCYLPGNVKVHIRAGPSAIQSMILILPRQLYRHLPGLFCDAWSFARAK
jgi:hypothetical protein